MGYRRYRFIAEGDNCKACNELDGKMVFISAARTGVNLPPMHPNCDCTIAIVDDNDRVVASLEDTTDLASLQQHLENKVMNPGEKTAFFGLAGLAGGSLASMVLKPFLQFLPRASLYLNTLPALTSASFMIDPQLAKSAVRTVWTVFAEEILGGVKGYPFAAAMMKHALQDSPNDVVISADYDPYGVLGKVRSDKEYEKTVQEALASVKDGENTLLFEKYYNFNEGDLKYTVHSCDFGVTVRGEKDTRGYWNLTLTFCDNYDYTELVEFWNEREPEDQIGWAGNNLLTLTQQAGALGDFRITIVVTERRLG